MKKWNYFPALIILSCCMFSSQAQQGHYNFMHLNVNEGLSHNEVLCFLKDHRGFLWIGTTAGLNRFDGYSVKVFQHNSRDSTSIISNSIQKLFETPDGKLAVMTSTGLTLYDPEKENFQNDLSAFYTTYGLSGTLNHIIKDATRSYWFIQNTTGIVKYTPGEGPVSIRHRQGDSTSVATDSISFFVRDPQGANWIIHTNGILEKLELSKGAARVVYRNYSINRKNNGKTFDYRVVCDEDGDLWVFMANNHQGVFYFDRNKKIIRHIHKESSPLRLNTDIVRSMVSDNQGLMWVGTDHGGINIIDKKKLTARYLLHRDENEKSISQNSINVLYKDNEGIIWVGTYKKGVSYFHENILRFPLYQHSSSDPSSLPYSDVNRFVEDDKGNLWIGTNGGGLIYFDRAQEKFTQFRHNPNDPGSLSSDVIVSLCIDHEKKLWIGTYYGGLNLFDGKKFKRYSNDPSDPSSLSDQNIWEIFEDSQRRLWIGTLSGGLDLLDRRTQTFSHYRSGDPSSIQSNYVAAITEDRKGNIWIGTTSGIDVLDRSIGRFIHYGSEQSNEGSLSSNNIIDIREDSKGRIWIGTSGGLSLFNDKTKTFRTFTTEDGLSHNSVLTVLEDSQGELWMSTSNGLSHLIVGKDSTGAETFTFRDYGEADGLQGKQFNENAACKTRSGELIFGGADGFNIFKPGQLGLNKNLPQIAFTGFLLLDRRIKAEENIDGKVLLPKAIAEASEVVLPPDKNVFSIEFAALNFFHPENSKYKYKLEGFDNDWISADSRSRKVTFTNLDPGDYTFRVKAANNDGFWNETGASLKITVLPPFWKTRTALVLYFMAILLALLVTRKLIQQREQMKFTIERERQEAMRMHELDMMKIKFFTNVSHEFRTPLTLILTPLEKMLRQAKDNEQENQFQLIQRNARRLLNLVNQLLDFRKLEVQEIRLNPSEGDIIRFIKETVFSFSDLSEKKDVRLDFHSTVESLETIFDQDKLEKILFNLLSNAFKFTSEHGAVSVTVEPYEAEGQKWLRISVRDTGIGISADKQEKIFERFFQNDLPRSMVNQGSGIGLSITKEFVKIHGGTIHVESEPGKGSCFVVSLPLTEVLESVEKPVTDLQLPEPLLTEDAQNDAGPEGALKRPLLLLVEDNEDFRFYLKDNLKLDYRVLEAKNGKDGWNKTLENLPDLIVSDVMMPEMNGMELCRKIKSDQRVSHIPVILLTARAAEEQKLEGYHTGADDYITKPFSFEILVSRIQNLIVQRQKFHNTFTGKLGVHASELNITPLDEKFIQNAVRCVEENVSKSDFSVEDLGRQLGISRAHMYKKIVALTGKSPLEFIRTIRLQQAAQLLEKSQLTVAEIAYQVGFNNPKYFARYFKEAYHVLPSAYAAGKRKGLL